MDENEKNEFPQTPNDSPSADQPMSEASYASYQSEPSPAQATSSSDPERPAENGTSTPNCPYTCTSQPNDFRPPMYPPYQPPQPQYTEPKKGKKVPVSRRVLIGCLICCLLISGIGAFAGTFWALRRGNLSLFPKSSTTTVVYRDTTSTAPPSSVASDTIESAAEIASRTVVDISAQVRVSSVASATSGGSGVIIAENGYIITCAHIVSGAVSVNVTTSDGQVFSAEIVGYDTMTDIAVLKVDVTGLPFAVIGDSDALRVAQTVLAIGNPLGVLDGTVTVGNISALKRNVKLEGRDYELMQTDAAINYGNSGGGLFDLSGRLIGIVNAKATLGGSENSLSEGLGFTIPINTAMATAQELMEHGYVSGRPALGITVINYNSSSDLSSILSSEYSQIVNYLSDYGVYFVADREDVSTGLEFGDRIIALDDIQIATQNELISLLYDKYKPGDTVTITVVRITERTTASIQKTMIDLEITLTERTES